MEPMTEIGKPRSSDRGAVTFETSPSPAAATPEQLKEWEPAPIEAIAHGLGTDIEAELPLLWAVTMLLRPKIVVEIGTRQGISTRTLAHAVTATGGLLYTIDPEDCRPYLQGVACRFIQATGEEMYERWAEPMEVLVIDTDSHTRAQTRMWLDTWVSNRLSQGGVALFHDIIPARPEIQVREAVMGWLEGRSGWIWNEYRSTAPVAIGPYGLGLLWRAQA